MRPELFLVAISIALFVRVAMHFIDKNRIKNEVESKGGRIVSISWNPFARGWFFEKNERHYDVTYLDRAGTKISTTCKTSFFTGVYWAEGPSMVDQPRVVSRLHCSQCGYSLQADWQSCPHCGKRIVV
jgi:zinc ribbon protein